MEAEKYIKNLEKEANESQQKLDEFRKLQKLYPDLEVRYNRWKTPFYCSKLVNKTANKFYTGMTCGCCSDAGKLFYMYEEVDGIKVYTNPYSIEIGEGRGYSYRDYIYPDNEEKLEKYGITSPEAIKSVKIHYDLYLDRLKDEDEEDDDYDY